MAWTWQGKTYETRAALDEAKRRHYEAISARCRAEHLARLREDKEKVHHYRAISAQYRPKRRFTFALD